MDPFQEIRERFKKYPDAQYEEGRGWIRYIPASRDGFIVDLHADGEGYLVSFEGWHEHFHDSESALNCFAFGLSDACRLKIVTRSGRAHKWIVESFNDGEWISYSETGLLLFAFWRTPCVEYRQNRLIETTGHQ